MRWFCLVLIIFELFTASSDAASRTNLRHFLIYARSNNPEYGEYKKMLKKARQNVKTVQSDTGPSIDLTAWSRVVSIVPEMDQPSLTIPLPTGDMTIPGKTSTLGDYDSHSIDLGIYKVIYAGGRLAGSIEQARLMESVSGAQLTQAMTALDAKVSMTFLSLVKTRQLHEAAKETLQLTREHARDVKNKLEAGLVTDNELLKAELRVTETEAMAATLDHQLAILREQLRILTSVEISPLTIFESPALSDRPEPDFTRSLFAAKDQRVELQVIDRQIELAEKQRDLLQREKLPTITAFGKISYGKPGPDFIENRWTDSYSAGINCSVNVWDSGRNLNRDRQMVTEIERLTIRRKTIESALELEVTQAILGITDAKFRKTVAERAVAQASENLRITTDRFKEGILTNTDFLDAEIAASNSRSALIRVNAELDQAWISYLLAIGKDLLVEL